MIAWLTIVNVTLTCWLFTGVPASVSITVISAFNVPAPGGAIDGTTVIATLFDGASVPLACDTGAYVLPLASSRIPQFKGASPLLVTVKLWARGFRPLIA